VYVFEKPINGWSGTIYEEAKLLASDSQWQASLGYSVSISGNTIVAGAINDDNSATDSGSAYVFEMPAGGWSGILFEDAKLLASDGAEDDNLGRSVSISGDTIVVGAPYHDSYGSAYVYRKPDEGWNGAGVLNEDAKLLASDGADEDSFGYVSISGDTIVVGAFDDDDNGNDSGSAYMFEMPEIGWSGTINEDAKLLASDGAANDYFGYKTSISDDTVIVGAFRDDDLGDRSGSAYVLVCTGACCIGSGCFSSSEADCFAADGTFMGNYIECADIPCPEPCPADLTGDDQVDIEDILVVLDLWGDCPDPCPPYCAGDLTEDCTVNIDDIFAILGMWGPCE